MKRPLRPSFLYFLTGDDQILNYPEHAYTVYPEDTFDDEYIFISYTRRSIAVDLRQFPQFAPRDRSDRLRFAVAATRAAEKRAFWIDFECVVSDRANGMASNDAAGYANEHSEDVYRICDVLRGASSMVVVHGPLTDGKEADATRSPHQEWSRTWGSRLWVLPELLLAPTEKRISVYTQLRGVRPEEVSPLELSKRDLAVRSCVDAEEVMQLIEHYDGSILLTPLELMQLSLRCLRRRTTVRHTDADLAYVLKGLLRRRPKTVPNESGFEAFASLSLANDSQKLLERLVCVLSPDPDADWSDMRDAWGMQLWDIEPSCQIAGIVDQRTVLLDGVYGASIHWDRLETVAFMKRETAFRSVAKVAARLSSVLFIIGISVVSSTRGTSQPGSGITNPLLFFRSLAQLCSQFLWWSCSRHLICCTRPTSASSGAHRPGSSVSKDLSMTWQSLSDPFLASRRTD